MYIALSQENITRFLLQQVYRYLVFAYRIKAKVKSFRFQTNSKSECDAIIPVETVITFNCDNVLELQSVISQ